VHTMEEREKENRFCFLEGEKEERCSLVRGGGKGGAEVA